MKAKTLLLASLVGLLPACSDEFQELESTKTLTSHQQTLNSPQNNMDSAPVDSFMKHVPNVEDALFYQPTEKNHSLYFGTDGANVTSMTEICDCADTENDILYPMEFTRTDNTCVNGVAHFTGIPTWTYSVTYTKLNGEKADWYIKNVPQEDYEDLSSTMSNFDMASSAKNRIQNSSGDYVHADSIYDNILRGNSSWTYQGSFPMTINSKGAQQNLKFSDFGFYEYDDAESNHTTKVYMGGSQESQIYKYNMPTTTFAVTAYGTVQKNAKNSPKIQLVLTTGKDAATYTLAENGTETIVLPFKNWYKVTIVRGGYSVKTYLEDVDNKVPAEWKMLNTTLEENQYKDGRLPNDLFTTEGWKVENHKEITRTSIASLYYKDQSGYVETVFHGYRQDASDTDSIMFTFCLGGTNRPIQNTATGLEQICVP